MAVAQGKVVGLVDVPVQTQQPLVGLLGDVLCLVATSVVAELLELLGYLLSFLDGDAGEAIARDEGSGRDLLDVLSVGEEEELVLDDGPTEGEADGVLILLGQLGALSDILACGRSVEVLIMVEVIDRAVQAVGPRLGDGVHAATREARLTDVEGSDDDL